LFQKISLSILIGVLAGVSSTAFLYSLDFVTHLRLTYPMILIGLPLAGLAIGYAYHKYGSTIADGNNLIIDEIHDPKKTVPLIMAPFIFIGTLLTHLFGGSAGREGTAVQMAGSLADQVSEFFKLNPSQRKSLLMAGAGAGFGSAIGAPLAGFIFGMEVIWVRKIRMAAVVECFLASYSAYFISKLLRAPHSDYPEFVFTGFGLKQILWILVAGVIFGLMTRFFILTTHLFENQMKKLIKYPPMRPFLGGVILLIFFWLEGSYQYAGLGIETIRESLTSQMSFLIPFYKSFFTTLTLGSGFKGGEFIPLVFIGASLGSALSHFIPLSISLLSSVGFASIFAAASKTPIACTMMAIEIFGWQITPYAFIGCMIAYFVSGKQGIYLAQRL